MLMGMTVVYVILIELVSVLMSLGLFLKLTKKQKIAMSIVDIALLIICGYYFIVQQNIDGSNNGYGLKDWWYMVAPFLMTAFPIFLMSSMTIKCIIIGINKK